MIESIDVVILHISVLLMWC